MDVKMTQSSVTQLIPDNAVSGIEVAAENVSWSPGDKVQYWSTTAGQWIPAKILECNVDGTVNLNCKKNVKVDKIRNNATHQERHRPIRGHGRVADDIVAAAEVAETRLKLAQARPAEPAVTPNPQCLSSPKHVPFVANLDDNLLEPTSGAISAKPALQTNTDVRQKPKADAVLLASHPAPAQGQAGCAKTFDNETQPPPHDVATKNAAVSIADTYTSGNPGATLNGFDRCSAAAGEELIPQKIQGASDDQKLRKPQRCSSSSTSSSASHDKRTNRIHGRNRQQEPSKSQQKSRHVRSRSRSRSRGRRGSSAGGGKSGRQRHHSVHRKRSPWSHVRSRSAAQRRKPASSRSRDGRRRRSVSRASRESARRRRVSSYERRKSTPLRRGHNHHSPPRPQRHRQSDVRRRSRSRRRHSRSPSRHKRTGGKQHENQSVANLVWQHATGVSQNSRGVSGPWGTPSLEGLPYFAANVVGTPGVAKVGSDGPARLPPGIATETALASKNGNVRPGDWTCPGCRINVFASKASCFKCGSTRDGSKVDGKGEGKGAPPPPEKFSSDLWERPRESIGLKLIGELCPPAIRWNYVLKDEGRRSYAACHPCPFTPEQCKTYFAQARDGTDWKQPEGPQGPIPRKTAWMVVQTCACTYRYGSIEVQPQVFPPWMLELMQCIMPYCGLMNTADWPTSCNLNLYEDGGMSVGWHSDDERLFQGKFQDIRIISFSLGVTRKFELRANWPESGEKSLHRVLLSDGDLCTMEGMLQKHFQHRVPREENIQGPRINLTWRWIVKHAPKCPAGRIRGIS